MQLPPFSKEPQLPCLLFRHIFRLRPNETLIQHLMPILRLLEVNTRRYPSPIIRLEQFMRRLPQGEPILILGPLPLVRKFAELESNLAAVAFPGYGSLYFRNALPAALQESKHRVIDVDETYCLGPMYHGSWPGGFAADPEHYAQFSGPCITPNPVVLPPLTTQGNR